jgi:hypothetical protein
MDSDCRAAIISMKGSTGISLHADRDRGNKTQRVHVSVHFPWIPESTIQQMGRTMCSNQISAPLYISLSTDVPGALQFQIILQERLAKWVYFC